MKNPLRKICTAGSVRGEIALSHGRPIRARSWKRRIEAKERLPLRVVSSTRNLSNDFHYAFRGLRKSPGFAVTAILTLIIGAILAQRRIKSEEAMLCARFGEEYDAYKRVTDALIPAVW